MNGVISNFTSILGLLGLPILLGLLHGLSPCEHSWPILAPFAITAKTMKKLFYISLMFCAGTTVACILLGIAFGVIGDFIPMNWSAYMGAGTAGILIILGIILIFKPTWLHFDHEHDDHDHDHGHSHSHETSHSHSKDHREKPAKPGKKKFKHGIYWGMFSLSFINMILPCPATLPMYTLALKSDSILSSVLIFLAYAIATTLVVLIMTYFIGRASMFLKKLNQEKYEVMFTRISGVLIAIFGLYMALEELNHIYGFGLPGF
ncbi:MAG: hypothetical protein A3C43_05135 [Candidatus Schekmanbacteria bacterium RIFCSPHIGHO2_02_FULL_38_11]|uniref:Urease accessory protein UreH-like transmembrane domain-containing protein n=1 Tax=Candidatus Schekmanbacteria bacterium RIFCSPLOWO2_12_FULL_38_15 TaxID=1817883 RepID=A0A1F7SDX5_9BACT|nr:MAG: hypothetical protein A2043_03400 [Candidatus Schekmanbacteria bacterium GWA2_38_9]OGL51444.1 MAG: hypothetical protein A3G31_06230 [Candidatus Schekmanbacteria bacterium RIFCSPLOWO2_12_FULL_38_15]OGL51549.1 MAG: hypothetical protein A3H37_09335 [Candidatus Schekmanbacteria bacterium RIFCSPLOWO2_02_FULL_38_14]OGL53174.1 MAG: hypothetical protein A3C43_05135 [Candidatus Schekmanbacteria bacterium RIFCSPHIGHO2_02_FULL_38_11]